MEFPKLDFADEAACFHALFDLLHAGDLHCPNPKCGARDGVQRKQDHVQPWRIRNRCRHCGRTFNAWSGTPLQGTHRPPSEILQIMKANVEGESTLHLAQEMDCDWKRLAAFRHKLQPLCIRLFGTPPEKKNGESKTAPVTP